MIRELLLIACLPAALRAQETKDIPPEVRVGLEMGRVAATLPAERTLTGPLLGVLTQVDFSNHLGAGLDVIWLRSGVEDPADGAPSGPPPAARPEYVMTDLAARLSWRVRTGSRSVVGATLSAGGWLGWRTGGTFRSSEVRRADFGNLWGLALFGDLGRARLQLSLRAYHGERPLWDGGPTQRAAPAVLGFAYRVR